MKAKEAAEIIKGIEEVRGALPEDGLLIEEALNMAVKALEVQEWIPCSERLPDEKDAGILKKLGIEKRSDDVLATVEIKGERVTVTACTYDGKWKWNMKYAFPDYKVIAWMPLPEPYREEGEKHEGSD